MPIRLDATFVDINNEKRNPVMLHRAILGSFERFIGILIEQYEAKFPIWLAPYQIILLSITDRNIEKCLKFNELIILALLLDRGPATAKHAEEG